MTNNTGVAEMIGNNLGNLKDDDGNPVQLVGYGGSSVLPQGMADVQKKASKTLGTALVNLIEADGNTILRNDELAVLQTNRTDAPITTEVRVECAACNTLLFTMAMNTPGVVRLNAGVIINHLSGLTAQCSHEAKP